MRGFQPQHYADGGLVQRALGLLSGRKKQIDEAVKVASQDTRQASAPAPPPAPVKTTQDGKFDEKRTSEDNPAGIGFANGGQVRRPRGFVVGPGTGTSDSIPAQLSNGEYVLPADTVRAVGVDKLDALREATHKPVRGFAPKTAPEEPRQFFRDGGPVKRLHLADAGVVTQKRLDEEGRVPSAAPAPQAPPATDAQVQGLYQDWQDKKTPWYMPTPKNNIEERAAEEAYTKALAGSYAGSQLQHQPGAKPPASPASTPSQDAAASATTPTTATLNSVMEVQRRRDAINGTTDANAKANTNDAAAPPAPESQGREVLPGAYTHGRGQYSDRADGMGFSPGFTGKPNAQNDAAAEALSARSQQESTNRLAQQQYQREVADAQAINAAGTQYAPNSGLQYQWMSDIRDPRTLALRNASVGSKIFQNKGEELMANKARQARVAGVQAAIGSQMHDAQAAQTAALQSKNTLAGNLATEQMRQDGENQRSARGFAVGQQRLGIEAGKAAQESTARGFDIRAAQRREGILQRYDAAKTDQERVQLQRQYPDVFGREKNAQENLSNNFMRRKVPVLDEQGRPTGMEREEIVDLRTSRVLGGADKPPPAPQDASKRIKGNEYTAPNGQTVIWNGDGWLS